MPAKSQLEIDGTRVEVSNLEKVLYPKTGFTKGQVIEYYIRISPQLLPHLKDRPLTLKRYPEGVGGFFFYEKQCPGHRPKWIHTAHVPRSKGGEIVYCVMNDLPALVWVANLADLELHTFLHCAPRIGRPTVMVFDLDPGAPADMIQSARVALLLQKLFDALKLKSFPKTSGSKGIQVYVPLNTPVTHAQTKEFARTVADRLQFEFPELVVARMQKALRKGKVFVDWSQNDDHKTTVCVYSLRAREQPTVSTPVTWAETEAAVKKKSGRMLTFGPDDVLKRVAASGDLFEPVIKLKQKLPSLEVLHGFRF